MAILQSRHRGVLRIGIWQWCDTIWPLWASLFSQRSANELKWGQGNWKGTMPSCQFLLTRYYREGGRMSSWAPIFSGSHAFLAMFSFSHNITCENLLWHLTQHKQPYPPPPPLLTKGYLKLTGTLEWSRITTKLLNLEWMTFMRCERGT